jgi:hypothetical protein
MRLGLTRGRGPLRRGLKGSPDSIRDSAAAAVALQCRQSGLMAGATSVSADRSSFDGLRHPNPAFPTAIRPQVSKAARSWSVARQVHRPPAVRAGGSCCDVVANRPHQTLYRQHDLPHPLYRQHDLPHRGTFSNDRLKFKRMFETVTRRKQGIFVIS